MKLTIDTTEKTIQLHDEVEISELNKIIEQFNLNEYKLVKNYTYTIPKMDNIPNWREPTIVPYYNEYKPYTTISGGDVYKSRKIYYKTNPNEKNSKKILLKG